MAATKLNKVTSLEQIIDLAKTDYGQVVVVCDTYEECEHITSSLLEVGAKHGHSGWSERILKGDHGDKWINPIIDEEGYIEYCSADSDLDWYEYIIHYENVYIECDDDSLYEAVNSEDLLNFLAAGGAYGLK